jgi:hypothetical protein
MAKSSLGCAAVTVFMCTTSQESDVVCTAGVGFSSYDSSQSWVGSIGQVRSAALALTTPVRGPMSCPGSPEAHWKASHRVPVSRCAAAVGRTHQRCSTQSRSV